VPVTEFILLISEHLSNRIVSDAKHAGLVWSTRQPILQQCAVHSTCHNLARAKIFNSVPC